jgi:hypothetical protein
MTKEKSMSRLFSRLLKHKLNQLPQLIVKNIAERTRLLIDGRVDKIYGVDTKGVEQLAQLTVDSPNVEHGVYYEATPTRLFRVMLDEIARRESISYSDYVFVDYGAGKGRAMMLASEYAFKEIIGVEFAKELIEAMRSNIHHFAANRNDTRHFQCVHMDATEFELPKDPCFLYFYNPFWPPVMEKVIEKIKLSYLENPRPIIVLYYNPLSETLFINAGFLRDAGTINLPHEVSRKVQRRARYFVVRPDWPESGTGNGVFR